MLKVKKKYIFVLIINDYINIIYLRLIVMGAHMHVCVANTYLSNHRSLISIDRWATFATLIGTLDCVVINDFRRKPIVYPYQSQCTSAFDFEEVPVFDIYQLAIVPAASWSCEVTFGSGYSKEMLKMVRAFPQRCSMQHSQHCHIPSAL